MVFYEEFLRKGMENSISFEALRYDFYFFCFPFFYFLASPINLNAFLIQYLTISSLVLRSFKNLPNKARKTNSNLPP